MIYFIQVNDDGPIKIGYSRSIPSVIKRLQSLQSANPYQLNLIGLIKGTRDVERHLHEKYGKHRIRGEWFSPNCGARSLLGEYKRIGGEYSKDAKSGQKTIKRKSTKDSKLKAETLKAEKNMIKDALITCKGNFKETSKHLGLTQRMLRYKLNKHNLLSFMINQQVTNPTSGRIKIINS